MVLVTANFHSPELAQELKVTQYLSKPFHIPELTAVVRQTCCWTEQQ